MTQAQQLLMIEDDSRLASMVGEYLRQSGYGFTHAADGHSGLAALKASPADLVILDLMLPDMDGLEVCRRIKSQGAETARPHRRDDANRQGRPNGPYRGAGNWRRRLFAQTY